MVGNRRHLLFCTDNQMELLGKAKIWYMDGTFRVVKDPFQQLFSIHAFVRSGDNMKQIPLVFVIMSGDNMKRIPLVFVIMSGDNMKQIPLVFVIMSGDNMKQIPLVFVIMSGDNMKQIPLVFVIMSVKCTEDYYQVYIYIFLNILL